MKNKAEFPPKDGLRHYYLRDVDNRRPFACVAFKPGTASGSVIRGISICATTDQWDREEARKKAAGRCKKAAATGICSDVVVPRYRNDLERGCYRLNTLIFMDDFHEEFEVSGTVYKSAFDVPATVRELRIMSKDVEYAKGPKSEIRKEEVVA